MGTSIPWLIPSLGRYTVTAFAILNSSGYGSLDARGATTKSFSIDVV